MKKWSRSAIGAVSTGALVLGAVVGFAGPASAGNLKAYPNHYYAGTPIGDSTLAYLDVADDITSSIRNESSYYYSAQYTSGLVGYTMFTMAPGQLIPVLGGSQDNQIDHFIR